MRAIAAGGHTCALTSGGGVKCWGGNYSGQLGDGTTTTPRLAAVDVVGADQRGERDRRRLAVTPAPLSSGGGVEVLGSQRFSASLGDGTTTQRLTSVDVVGLTSGVSAIAAGAYHTCALTSGGGVKCWGTNGGGALGDGTTAPRLTAADVAGLTSGVHAIAVGALHSCALTTGGGVKCWGGNYSGQLGDGTKTTPRLAAVDVVGLTSGVTAIAAGRAHTCALISGSGVKCWGANWSGELGDGTTTDRVTAVDVAGLTSGVRAIAAGGHTCALTTGGGVKCWGGNYSGQLGDGTTTTPRLAAVDVVGLTSGVSAIAVGSGHTCAISSSGGAECWGSNFLGQLGDGTFTHPRLTAVDVVGLTSGVSAIAAGESQTCALTSGGGVKCWGDNSTGQLGNGEGPRLVPVTVLMSGLPATYPIMATASPTGGGTVTCAPYPVPDGGTSTCTATANPGYVFGAFSGDCSGSTCTLANVTAAKSVEATFNRHYPDLEESDFAGFGSAEPRWLTASDASRGMVAVTAPISAGQTSRLERTFIGPGYLDFAWKLSAAANVDFLTLHLDGNEIAYRSGPKDWLLMAVPIPPGPHVVGWEYEQASTTAPGTAGGRVDAVTFTAVAAGEHGTLQAQANAAPGGGGRIVSSPALLDCGAGSVGRCQATLPYGEHVLFAVPASGSTFAGWTGCDAVYGAVCKVMLGSDRSVAALFEPGKSYEVVVQEAYVAYYGRPADFGGQQYWANRLRDEGGNLTNIMQAFGNSEEANRLFGNMSDENTVTTLYRQILGRDPECQSYAPSCGWGWWVNELASGGRTRQTIALDLLNGARNEDRDTVNNRVRASSALTGQWSVSNQTSSLTPLQVEALWRQYLSYVSSVASSMEEAIFDAPGWAWKTVGDSQ